MNAGFKKRFRRLHFASNLDRSAAVETLYKTTQLIAQFGNARGDDVSPIGNFHSLIRRAESDLGAARVGSLPHHLF